MLTPLAPGFDEQCVLSPKETEERCKREATLKKIDGQIDQILSLNSRQHSQYKDQLDKIVFIEEHYKRDNAQLQQDLQAMSQKYDSLEVLYLSLKEELEHTCTVNQQAEMAKHQLNKEIGKLKSMIKNQESLIDEYRNSIEEEVSLEREFMKAEFEQQRTRLEMDFNRALGQMEKQYEEKAKKAARQSHLKDYQVEFHQLKRYISDSRNCSQKDLRRPEARTNKAKPSHSEYSTTDQENRHNQPIFML